MTALDASACEHGQPFDQRCVYCARTGPARRCPDDGACHHGCPADPNSEPCFRTLWCAPFSAYNGGTQDKPGQWKEDDR